MNPKQAQEKFGKLFRSPGHVHVLNAASGLLNKRLGHTEFTTALMIFAGLAPTATICEMMYDDGKARPYAEAVKYANTNGFVMLSGDEIIAEWRKRENHG
jgi:3,4-dihydroxy 2-butanone 4-phosphate synthase